MKIAIYGQYYQNSTEPIIKDIFTFLSSNNVEMVIEENFLNMLYDKQLIKKEYKTFSPSTTLDDSFEMLISIGGDGTILRAAALVRNSGVPLLGINAGRLGFLAKVQKENIDSLLQFVIDQNYTTSERTLLGITCEPKNDAFAELNFAMNEVTVSRKDTTSMITVETYLNNEYLNSYWADGLIISTPTGSTAYSLSCGGPIISPNNNNFAITPIAPHNLNVRPLIVNDEVEIKLHIESRAPQYSLSLDSRLVHFDVDKEIILRKAKFQIHLLHPKTVSFYETIRQKLLWGKDKRN